ncbi:TPA: hypothetical protein QB256_000302 [Pasteurella multocida]|nr:hypothetical protein [Pasteurella multocida]
MKHINLWNLLAVFIIALVLGVSCHPVSANEQETDYYNHYLSEQISKERLAEMEREAKAEWAQEYGDIPPNLASEQLIYLRVYAMEQQEFLNGSR